MVSPVIDELHTPVAEREEQPVGLADRVSREFLVHHRVCPTTLLPDGSLAVAVTDESLLDSLDDLGIAYGRSVVARPVSSQDLDMLIARLTSTEEDTVELSEDEGDQDRFTSDIRDLVNQPPVVRYVSLLIREAYEARASDIHLESTRAGLQARFRVDGALLPGIDPPGRLDRAVVSRVKLLADLDIAERRRPQDGRLRVRLKERELDLRVSTVPTIYGESVVLRLLERSGPAIALESLGLSAELLVTMQGIARKPHGMILVTRPTGSGKTTTLYAALGLRDATAEKIITLEDPVEYALAGVTQVPIHTQTGVTFASMLRSVLRQDPDVVLVGEMRDTETAELAVQAALTGPVVFATLHTNDAVGAIPRLLNLGVPPYLISAPLEAVLAQRLVRRICEGCREPSAKGRGCPACRGTGYRGRTGLFELLLVTDEIREAIVAEPSRSRIEALARASGMLPLRVDGSAKVEGGVTTTEEVLRVTQE